MFDALKRHLVPPNSNIEEAAFIFARCLKDNGSLIFEFLEALLLNPDDFAFRSAYYLELSDATRARVIKRAHDLGASLIEFHSHVDDDAAAFSPSDLAGFGDIVPHLWWRLKQRPYAAIVMTSTGFDALAWVTSPTSPVPVDELILDDRSLFPTNHTIKKLK